MEMPTDIVAYSDMYIKINKEYLYALFHIWKTVFIQSLFSRTGI